MGIKKWFKIFKDGFLPGKTMPHQFAFLVDNPVRNLILSPKKLADRLQITESMNILDFGCGPGFYSTEMAKRIPRGQLYLLDVQPEMLDKAKERLKEFKHIINLKEQNIILI